MMYTTPAQILSAISLGTLGVYNVALPHVVTVTPLQSHASPRDLSPVWARRVVMSSALLLGFVRAFIPSCIEKQPPLAALLRVDIRNHLGQCASSFGAQQTHSKICELLF